MPSRRLLPIQGLCSTTQLTSIQHGALAMRRLCLACSFAHQEASAQPGALLNHALLANILLCPAKGFCSTRGFLLAMAEGFCATRGFAQTEVLSSSRLLPLRDFSQQETYESLKSTWALCPSIAAEYCVERESHWSMLFITCVFWSHDTHRDLAGGIKAAIYLCVSEREREVYVPYHILFVIEIMLLRYTPHCSIFLDQ